MRLPGARKYALLPMLAAAFLAACASPEVQFQVREGSHVQLKGVQRLAVLDFATPYVDHSVGGNFALEVADLLHTRANLAVISPVETRSALAPMRLMASAFNDPGVVVEAGRNLGADALLFGDVQTAEVQRAVKRETYVVQNGVRNETVNETGADGKVHAVTYAYPITQEVWRDHVTRTFVFHAEARLVNTRDASVLWQESSDWSGESKAQEEANGQRTGDWSTDEEFRNRQLHQAAQHLLAKLLPRMLTRNRQLAECAQEGPYAEWISTGNQAAVAGRWEQAGESWLKAVSLSPGRPEALANLGVFYEHQGDYNQALQDYKLAARQLKKNWGDYAREVEKFLEKH